MSVYGTIGPLVYKLFQLLSKKISLPENQIRQINNDKLCFELLEIACMHIHKDDNFHVQSNDSFSF